MFVEPTSSTIGEILEKLLPYLGTGVVGALVLAVFNKLANRQKESSDINKTTAETEQIRLATIQSLSKELGEAHVRLRTQTDLNVELQKQHLDKDFRYASDLAGSVQEKIDAIARHAECEIKNLRHTQTARRLMEKLELAYWETNADGTGIYTSAAWLRMFNVTKETQSLWINSVIERDRDRLMNQWFRQLTDTDTVTPMRFSIVRGGKTVSVQSIYAVVRGKDGEVCKIIGVTS